nr:MAG TPA: hypothetical protein [Caudoviricetes sp.]
MLAKSWGKNGLSWQFSKTAPPVKQGSSLF